MTSEAKRRSPARRPKSLHRAKPIRTAPPVRVIVLNYNGQGYIEPCLASVLETDYPHLSVVMVDNGSTDGSPERVRKQFPRVELINAGGNLGFSRGNNLALRRAPEQLVALLNPDTTVDPNWLQPLVDRVLADPITAGVGPKILYRFDRVPVRLSVEGFHPGAGDRRVLGVRIYNVRAQDGQGEATAHFNRGMHGWESDHAGRQFMWSATLAEIAVGWRSGPLNVEFDISTGGSRADVEVTLDVPDHQIAPVRAMVGNGVSTLRMEIEHGGVAAKPVIENAGILPLPDGSMRDRGTRLSNGHVWNDWDGAEYATPREVFAVKGGAALYRRDMLYALGYLDDGIFMYYEDADLCWRARRRGWRFWYEPASVVRHAHAALSREWSPRFIRSVEFGKLRMLAKNAPMPWVWRHAAESAKFGGVSLAQAGRKALFGSFGVGDIQAAAARADALARSLLAAPETRRLRLIESALAPLDGRELRPFLPDA